jgi:hypothetical protein
MKKCYIIIAFLFAGLYSFAETTLFVPVLVAPANNATEQMPNVLLDWNPVSGEIGLYYEIQIDTSGSFSNPVVLQTELSSIRPLSGLQFATKYFWHVRAIDASGTSPWSETWSFDVVVTVTLKSPADNAQNQAPNAKFTWSGSSLTAGIPFTGVSFIEYQIDTVNTFDSPYTFTGSVSNPDTTFANMSNLLFGTRFFWRMRALTVNSTSVWSGSRSFTTIGSVTLKTPNDLASNQLPVTSLEWNKIDGISKYIIMIADNPDFNLASSKETTKVTLNTDTLQFGTTYYWKVQAVHTKDIASSVVRSFSTINTVTLTTPANNETGVVLTPVFNWEAITGSEQYDLWLCESSTFNDGNLKQYKVANTNPTSGMQDFQLPAYILENGISYFWKVRALVPGDTSTWSETWTFRVATTGLDEILPGKSAMSVYPNPAKDKIKIVILSAERTTLRLSISNLLGNKLISDDVLFTNGRSVNDINVNDLPDGVYFVKIQKDSSVYMSKLIIDR